ncbi:MAG: hypothetical protein ACFFB2_04420 [Promethearchaeota archaeon]
MVEQEEIIHDSRIDTSSKAANFLQWFNPFARGIGMWAWLLQRITGLLLIMYVIFHFGMIFTLAVDFIWGLNAGQFYNSLIHWVNSPILPDIAPLKFGEIQINIQNIISIGYGIDIGVIGILVYHGFNGIRVVLFDLGIGIHRQKTIFWIMVVLGVVTWFLALLLILIVPEIVILSGE